MRDLVRRVPSDAWFAACVEAVADGWTIFDWLGAVDEIGREDALRVVCRLGNADGEGLRLETLTDRDQPELPTLGPVFAGATWHEREAHDFFGIHFVGGDDRRLLLPASYHGRPLRKDEVLGARAARPWPGAKEPGEVAAAGSRRLVPPGVPDAEVWGDRVGEPASADEVAASITGGRVRRRR